MEPRINLMTNELGAKIGKRFYNVSLADIRIGYARCSTHGAALGGLSQQRPCGVRVAHRGLLVESEYLGEIERIGPVGQGLFELPVDAEPRPVRASLSANGCEGVVVDGGGRPP